MNFSKQIMIIFTSVTVLLACFSVFMFVSFKRVDIGKDKLIDDKVYVFSKALLAVNEAKSLEAAGAHFLIVNTQITYDLLQEAHLKIRNTIQALMADPRFEKYREELSSIAEHEKMAYVAGAEAFKGRLEKRLNIAQVVERVSAGDGLGHVIAMQKKLAKIEADALAKWHEASFQVQGLHRESEKLLKYASGWILLLIGMFVAALWKILQQKNHLDIKTNQLLETEKAISKSRKEAVEIVSHDLRSPLSSVKMCLDVLDDSTGPEREMLLQISRKSVMSGLRLIERILDHTRIESGSMSIEKAECNLKELLNDQVIIFKNLCSGKEIVFEFHIHESVDRCLCDADRLCQVLSNLVGNALKFSVKGQLILFNAALKNSYLEIEVKDQGPGIPKEDVDYIFERYWKSAQNPEAPGLDLRSQKPSSMPMAVASGWTAPRGAAAPSTSLFLFNK